MVKKPSASAEPIFVNHRKLDTEREAERLAEGLKREFGEGQVFLDRPSIEAGANWPARVEAAAKGAIVMLALIGEKWNAQDPKTWQSYLFDPNDWVRRELEWALQQPSTTVIPVFVGDIEPPSEAVLQNLGELAQLPFQQGAKLRTRDWETDFQAIVARLLQLSLDFRSMGSR